MKKIICISIAFSMIIGLCSCDNIRYMLGLYNCYMPSDDFAAFNGENYYYVSDGVLYEDGKKFFDDKTVTRIFANSSYVYAASEKDVTVLDFDGDEQFVLDIVNASEICGDDEYVFFKYVKDGAMGNFCEYLDVASGEVYNINELISERCNSGDYCNISGDMSSAYGYASYVDVGSHRIFALVSNADITSTSYVQDIYLCNSITDLIDVDDDGTMYFFDTYITVAFAVSENLEVTKAESDKSYSGNTVVCAQYHNDDIIIAEQNDGYYDPSFEPLDNSHISSVLLKRDAESKIYEEILKTDENAQIIGYYNGKAIVIDYDDRRIYSDDTQGNTKDIYTFEKGDIDTYTYFEIVGDKLFAFGAQSYGDSNVKMLFSSDLA